MRPHTPLRQTLLAAAILLATLPLRLAAADAPPAPDDHPGIRLLHEPISDPLDGLNRPMESVNAFCVRYLAHPVSLAYNTVVPETVQRGVDNFAHNLLFPLHLVTNLLQGKGQRAWVLTRRFVVNTTVGLLGFRDAATPKGLPRCPEDFGQTLAVWGVGPGCYLNLPLLGPSNVRDALTKLPDMLLNPAFYVTGASLALNANSLFANAPFLNNYFASSNGTYPTTRLAYTLAREADIRDGRFPEPTTPPDESLGVLKLKPGDRMFYARADHRAVRIPGAPADAPELPYLLFRQKRFDGRILLVLPGLSSTKGNADILGLAELFHQQGLTVAVISSTFTPEFFSATGAGLPGLLSRDVEHLDHALTAIRDDILQREKANANAITPTVTVFGVSLGAINTLHLAARDSQGLSPLHAARFIAVNPPRDPLKALQTLDACFDLPLSWPADTRHEKARLAVQRIAAAIVSPNDAQPPQLDLDDSRFLIGLNTRLGLLEIIRAAHLNGLDDALAPLIRTDSPEHLEHDAFALSYDRYIRQLLFPLLQRQGLIPADASLDAFIAQSRLDTLAPHLQANPKVRLFHNQNDLLLRDGDLDWLQRTFAGRAVIFPRGGHLGNLTVPAVRKAIVGVTLAP